MVITQVPPLWTDRDDCFRCRTSFTAFTRKHHCRACGETFCAACSSKQIPILEYGVENEVRVCIACYDRIKATGSVHPEYYHEDEQVEYAEEDDDDESALQLAISLSEKEAQEKERQKKLLTQQYARLSVSIQSPATPLGSAPYADEQGQNYWDVQTKNDLIIIKPSTEDQYVRDHEIETFVNTVNGYISNMKFRMLSNQQRGRNILNDTAVQSVYLILQQMYPEHHRLIKSLDDKQAYYEGLQDKLNQLKDAREALIALREEHSDNKKRQNLERERQRQIQLAVKLDDMRQKKQAYLEYQRQLHLQRLAEQEAEMQTRLDQQRRYTQQREQQNQVMMPYAQPSPPVPVGYYHSVPSNFTMAQLPNALPAMMPPAQILPNQTPYSHQFLPQYPTASAPFPNDQTLISFD